MSPIVVTSVEVLGSYFDSVLFSSYHAICLNKIIHKRVDNCLASLGEILDLRNHDFILVNLATAIIEGFFP